MALFTDATPKPLVTHSFTLNETHTYTHTYTHSLKWRVWNWAGTWNKYSKQLSFSPAPSTPFPVNIFTFASFIYSRYCLLLITDTFSPPSPPVPHRQWYLSHELWTKCDSIATITCDDWFMASDVSDMMSRLWLLSAKCEWLYFVIVKKRKRFSWSFFIQFSP